MGTLDPARAPQSAKARRTSRRLTAFQRAMELGANGPDIQYAFAAVMVNQQRLTKAKAVLEQLLRTAPDHAPAKGLLAELQE